VRGGGGREEEEGRRGRRWEGDREEETKIASFF